MPAFARVTSTRHPAMTWRSSRQCRQSSRSGRLATRSEEDRDWITETVFEVADGILGQGFEPTPSFAACSVCDYRIACPAAEK